VNVLYEDMDHLQLYLIIAIYIITILVIIIRFFYLRRSPEKISQEIPQQDEDFRMHIPDETINKYIIKNNNEIFHKNIVENIDTLPALKEVKTNEKKFDNL
jgi:hypothetical protein